MVSSKLEVISSEIFSRPVPELTALLESDPHAGLDAGEAAERLKHFGRNELRLARPDGPLKKLLLQFHQPLLYILMAAALTAGLMGELVDAAVIFGVVVINALIGFVQEFRAEKAIEALSKMVPTTARAVRGGQVTQLDAGQLVPGDLVLLESGDRVPADLRLLDVKNLQVDESALTGESVPVFKNTNQLAAKVPLADRVNCAFAGSLVSHGRGRGMVFATGNKTEAGRIARLVQEAVELSTPLTRKIAHFSTLLLWAILALAGFLFLAGLWQGRPVFDMFMAAIALAVGAIPEGLPAAVTITLAIGVARMARRQAIIRKLPAVETLGSTTVICSDKTGTLTENQMTVVKVYAAAQEYQVTGSGYGTKGEIISSKNNPIDDEALRECLLAGLLCNDTHLRRKGELHEVVGDPTEAALLVSAAKAGLSREETAEQHPRLDHIPFESEHQFMATLHRRPGDGRHVVFKKGSLERVLSRCDSGLDATGRETNLDREAIHAAAERFAAEGLRVLAFARHHLAEPSDSLQSHHVESGLVFVGLQAMIDPPRPEAITAVEQCHNAGIRVKMITGDHPGTAMAIARQLGIIGEGGDVLTGVELDRLGDSELTARVMKTDVFARVAPEQKLRLVRHLQQAGQVVAMTGDGVNDAPSLKQADIGIAMGRGGTEVAKSASDMILTDDNFASIEAAVEEGRGVFDNLRKFIFWIIPTNAGVALVLTASVLFGLELPALPVQLLWLNLTTAVLLGLALVFEPLEKGIMSRPPRDPKAPLLDWPVLARTGLVSLMMTGAAFTVYFFVLAQGGEIAVARTAVINSFVSICIFYLLSCRSFRDSAFQAGWWSNPWIWAGMAAISVSQWLFSQTPLMNLLFHTAPLDGSQWLLILGLGVGAFLVVETEKWIRRLTGSV